jgi:hypothetical protein
MSTHFAPADEQSDAAAERAARRFAVLAELTETGMEISRRILVEVRVLSQVETVEDLKLAPTSAELSLAFSRVSRAVRQTLALERKFEEPVKAAKETPEEAEAERLRAAEHGARVRRKLTHLFMKAGPGFEWGVKGYEQPLPGEFDDEDDADEDLDDPDEAMEAGRQASDAEVLAEVCADLGVELDVSRFGAADEVFSVRPEPNSESGERSADPLHHPAGGPEGALPAPVRRGDRQIVGDPMDLASQGPASHPPTGEELVPSSRRIIPPP